MPHNPIDRDDLLAAIATEGERRLRRRRLGTRAVGLCSAAVMLALVLVLTMRGDSRPQNLSTGTSSSAPTSAPTTTTTAPTTTSIPIEATTLINRSDLGASVLLPALWSPTPGHTGDPTLDVDGGTGFAYISIGYTTQYGGPGVSDKLVTACQDEAFHVVKPYGSAPQVTMGVVDGHRACFIAPSGDAPATSRRAGGPSFASAAVLIEYRAPIDNGSAAPDAGLKVISDAAHLQTIASSIHFTNGN